MDDVEVLKTASIEAHDRISFSGTVKDSNNNPVPLTSVRVRIQTGGSGLLESQTLLADENGYFNGSVSLKGDKCGVVREEPDVHNRVHSGTPTNPSEWWDIAWGVGFYEVSLPNNTIVDDNYFVHICQEKLAKMCYYERDYNTGGSKWTCL
ncbi:hypothetical protein [Oceanospirillum multiglobuliferum]|uniref:hypothetical protein n=1 Tax=Oceanospirillum multiglobuliferum TaxID=64969 RepID=UPI001119B81C|nr:hypothetical protein [Oceanospirillum multiglobuliferum]